MKFELSLSYDTLLGEKIAASTLLHVPVLHSITISSPFIQNLTSLIMLVHMLFQVRGCQQIV